jgi:protein-L-isoaspartate O-methyltransferase
MEQLIYKHTVIKHPKDVEYFKEFPAPIMELIHSGHFTNINSTIAFFGPMLYFFARAIEAHKILEIGHAECYTSWYLANAVKDNGLRYQVPDGQYYGIDIVQSDNAKEKLKGLPATIINMDSINLNNETFKDIKFDMIFQDGAHDTEHVLHELEVLYPQLKGEGQGYFIMHDVYGPSEEAFHKLIPLLNTKYNFEWCRIWSSAYGLGILRKMDGYDPEKRYWFI